MSSRKDPHAGVIHDRHADLVLRLSEEARRGLRSESRDTWIRRLDVEIANVREAFAWLMLNDGTDDALRLAGALYRFWLSGGHLEEGAASSSV